MKRLLLAAVTAVTLLSATTASAHHDGKHGHQDTTTQESGRQ
jgi:opacity protein-like surface antigen